MAAPVVSTSNQIPSLPNDRIQLPPRGAAGRIAVAAQGFKG